MNICVLCASFNRAATTVAGLVALSNALNQLNDLRFKVFLLDDASRDGTAAQVRQALPDVQIVNGTGAMFWNQGMIAAYNAARAEQHEEWDAYLLFNDDTVVDAESVRQFFHHYIRENAGGPTACVGSVVDPDTRVETYGGYIRPSHCRPLRIVAVKPVDPVQSCDTFNGNFVLIPGDAFVKIGGLCPAYWHSYGDIDCGYALKRQGTRVLLVSTAIGTARRNPPFDMSSRSKRYKRLFGAPNSVVQTYVFYYRNGCSANWWLFATVAIVKKWFVVLFGNRI